MLTKEQTNWIRTNIRNRGIETIDLEIEMVDHISSAVEEKLEDGIQFRDAYKSVVNAFGPFGLQKLQDQKYGQLRKKGFWMILRNLKVYLTPPKLALTLLIASILFALYSVDAIRAYVFYTIYLLALFAPLIYFLSSKERTHARKNYSSIKAIFQIYPILYYFIFYIPSFSISLKIETLPLYWIMSHSLLQIIVSLAFYLSINQSIAEIKSEFGEMELA